MLNRIFFVICLFLNFQTFAQRNLVLNPSFEDDNGKLRCYFYPNGNFPFDGWSSGSEGSIDAFSTKLSTKCIMNPLNDSFAGQKPRTGNNYVGFSNVYTESIDYREYVRGTLSEPLEVGARYKIEFYVCLSDFSNTASNNFGIVFINNKTKTFSNVDPIPLKPDANYSGKPITERDKWTLLSFDFVATKPDLDSFLIGNFFSTSDTNFQILSPGKPIETYMLLDDVTIYKNELDFDLPSKVCRGEQIVLPTISKSGFTGKWNTEFDAFNSKTYIFIPDFVEPNRKQFQIDIEITNGFNYELISYCENYEYYIEAKLIDISSSAIVGYEWKLNRNVLKNEGLRLKVSDFQEFLMNDNFVELKLKDDSGCTRTEKLFFVGKNNCKIQKELRTDKSNVNQKFDLSSFGGVNLKIFNRFGNVVYEKNNYTSEWNGRLEDGNLLPVGTYMYQFESKNGEEISGWIQLINE